VWGINTCDPLAGATAELCDGTDNDCDGSVDEELGTTTCGMGLCQRTVDNCVDGQMQTCVPGEPSIEVCDGIDNDCNGVVDDGLGTTMCGVGGCQRTIDNCVNGHPQTCEPGQPSAEVCNNIDDDCDGSVDEELGTSSCGVGPCQRTVNNCVNGQVQSCVPGPAFPEVCDGIDNDCNGQIDEGLGTSACGKGACQRTVQNCINGVPQVCVPGQPSAEVCNNIDDDCDGTVDEEYVPYTCGTGACQASSQCVNGAVTCTPGTPSTEVCDGTDNDCDGSIDEELGTSSCGVGPCQRTVNNCVNGQVQSCVPGTPTPEVCGDGIDNNCNGTVDEGCNQPTATTVTYSGMYLAPVNTTVTLSAVLNGANAMPLSNKPVNFATYDSGVLVRSITVTTNNSGIAATNVTGLAINVYDVRTNFYGDATNLPCYTSIMLAIYDPNGGFVSGSGWFTSPEGAFVPEPSYTGKAKFGFNAKYKKDKNGLMQLTGETEFKLKEKEDCKEKHDHEKVHPAWKFYSESYDWLVVVGARGQFKGTGTINGAGTYGFILTCIDGKAAGGGGTDKIRIKIWDKATLAVVYDNQMGALDFVNPTTVTGGGSIKVK
jgi:hypothetical protein